MGAKGVERGIKGQIVAICKVDFDLIEEKKAMLKTLEGRARYVEFDFFLENDVPLEFMAYGYVQDISYAHILIRHKPLNKEYQSKDVIFVHCSCFQMKKSVFQIKENSKLIQPSRPCIASICKSLTEKINNF
jgi:hypothetical protein